MRRIAFSLALIFLTVAVVAAFVDSRHARGDVCREVEQIKATLREDEMERYGHLRRNLRLLRVEATPEVLEVAARDHARRMTRLQPGCPTIASEKPRP